MNNHRDVIAAFDFFTVPTLTFRVLYCSFVMEHHLRRILHFNITDRPYGEWILQQLREAFPLPCPYRYVIFDHDSKFSGDVKAFLKDSGLRAVRTGIRCPWQNGVAERWVESIRREMLDRDPAEQGPPLPTQPGVHPLLPPGVWSKYSKSRGRKELAQFSR